MDYEDKDSELLNYMTRIKGETVQLISFKTTGKKDPFGKEIKTEVPISIDNVLIAPVSADDIVNNLELYGKKAVYVLAIPKHDENRWEDCVVEFWGERFKVFGKPLKGMDSLIPLDWNKKVMVERYE